MLPSPTFYLLNHRGIRNSLSAEVQRAYDEHFAFRRLSYPIIAQEYLGDLMYLRSRYPFDKATFSDCRRTIGVGWL